MLTKETLESAIAEGLGIREIAQKFSSSVGAVHGTMKKYGLKSQKQSGWETKRQQYIDLLQEGLSNEEIAERMKVKYSVVRDYINNHNLKSYRKKKPDIFAGMKDGDKQTMLCKNLACSKTKRRCLYGGHCGNSDCCDYLLLTGKMREYEDGNPEMCHCYVYVSEATKKKIMAQRQQQARDITVV